MARKHHHRSPPLQHAPIASAAAPLAAPGRRLLARVRPSRLLAGEGWIPEATSRIRPPSPCCPSPDLDRLLAGPRVFALFPAGRQQASAPPLPINAGEAPRPLLLSLPSHTTATITPRAATKLVARIVPLPTRSSLALLDAAPPGHRDPIPPGVSPRALAPVLWPATACCCSCGCAAPLLASTTVPLPPPHPPAPLAVLASLTPAWRPARSAARPRAPGHAPARAAPSARNHGACSGGARST
nr:translation initiation factor IF-2-like [Aegilops tauschii subsp. strangulata]